MGQADERITLYRGAASIAISAVLAALFAFRAVLAAFGASSLSGPVWVTIDALLAAATAVRCFDRVILTREGLTVVRVGFPTRLVPGQIHDILVATAGSSTRLIAQEANGKRRLLTSRRTNTGRDRELHQFQEQARRLFVGHFGPLTTADTPADAASPTLTPRRCVRPACAAYRTPVTDEQCMSCGDRTQRVNSEHATG